MGWDLRRKALETLHSCLRSCKCTVCSPFWQALTFKDRKALELLHFRFCCNGLYQLPLPFRGEGSVRCSTHCPTQAAEGTVRPECHVLGDEDGVEAGMGSIGHYIMEFLGR